ncbi:hypothetical protein U0070_026481 [Myodes glareolus]|uniref:Uncharacterized protein n=1 Tax=Myodes glareolus TaxID=447135 RepID=A0AAW0JK89_MYOGA
MQGSPRKNDTPMTAGSLCPKLVIGMEGSRTVPGEGDTEPDGTIGGTTGILHWDLKQLHSSAGSICELWELRTPERSPSEGWPAAMWSGARELSEASGLEPAGRHPGGGGIGRGLGTQLAWSQPTAAMPDSGPARGGGNAASLGSRGMETTVSKGRSANGPKQQSLAPSVLNFCHVATNKPKRASFINAFPSNQPELPYGYLRVHSIHQPHD